MIALKGLKICVSYEQQLYLALSHLYRAADNCLHYANIPAATLLTEIVNSQLRIQWRPLSAVSKQLYLTLYTCAHEKRFTLILTDSFSCGRQYRSDPDLLARLQINPVGDP